MRLVSFNPAHIKQISLQAHQASTEIYNHDYSGLVNDAWTLLDGDETPVFIGGFYQIWNNRQVCWCLLSSNSGRHFTRIIRAVQKEFAHRVGRVECYVDPTFTQGHRFAKLLGFTCEAEYMTGFHANGQPAALYAMVN